MARCDDCGGLVKGAADFCHGCGAAAPAANSMLLALLVSLVVAAVAVTMVYLGHGPNVVTEAAAAVAPPAGLA